MLTLISWSIRLFEEKIYWLDDTLCFLLVLLKKHLYRLYEKERKVKNEISNDDQMLPSFFLIEHTWDFTVTCLWDMLFASGSWTLLSIQKGKCLLWALWTYIMSHVPWGNQLHTTFLIISHRREQPVIVAHSISQEDSAEVYSSVNCAINTQKRELLFETQNNWEIPFSENVLLPLQHDWGYLELTTSTGFSCK